jgi:hypothetical protein
VAARAALIEILKIFLAELLNVLVVSFPPNKKTHHQERHIGDDFKTIRKNRRNHVKSIFTDKHTKQ